MDGGPPHLPEEIIRDMLLRLPVESLIRFRCVCKHWKNLFKTLTFLADHLRHSHQNPLLLYECYSERASHGKCDPLHLCLVDREIRVREVQNAPRIPSMRVVRIVDSSNGLLCVRLHDTNHPILLCNLAIREVRQVPRPRYHAVQKLYVGFGFGPIVNDYRIVRLHASFFDDLIDGVGVLSVSTGSWKEIEVGNLKGVDLREVDGFTFDGASLLT